MEQDIAQPLSIRLSDPDGFPEYARLATASKVKRVDAIVPQLADIDNDPLAAG